MDPSRLRKRQMARRLGVSEQVLDQYLQLRRASTLQPASTEGAHSAGAARAGAGGADHGQAARGPGGRGSRWMRKQQVGPVAKRRAVRRG